jgi:hypothetical protein
VTVSVPWAAKPYDSNVFKDGSEAYYRNYCTFSSGPSSSSQPQQQPVQHENKGSSSFSSLDYLKDPVVNWNVLKASFSSSSSPSSSSLSSSNQPLNQPSSSSSSSTQPSPQIILESDLMGFYIPDPAKPTGVWRLSSFSPPSPDTVPAWILNMTAGLAALRNERGVRRLVIDVSGNGGGFVCLGWVAAQVLIF